MDEYISALAAFAAGKVAPRADELIRSDDFPMALWREMGAAGLTGFGLERWGGKAVNDVGFFDLAETLEDNAEVIGFPMTWMTHHAVSARVIAPFASETQAAHWLPRLAAGETTCCIAISEPGVGAHPKALSTRADRTATGWRINGAKAWLTNGPIAGVAVVLAIVDEVAGRKRFGTFMVPTDLPGVSREAGYPVDFLKPSGHCTLKLENVELPADAFMEAAGDAMETVLKRFRRIEDLFGMATASGGMAVQLRRLARVLPADAAGDLGALAADRELYRSAARALVAESGGDPSTPDHERRLLALRAVSRRFQAEVTRLLESAMREDAFLVTLTRDMRESGRIAQRVDLAKLAKAGSMMIGGAGS
ncbi:MAG: acyl-CoA dehydrogenase family protein [Pseudomonadota bacterium]|nr:acyl-CoA dehydrogenase family protein [Pseudomonadota bacterium]